MTGRSYEEPEGKGAKLHRLSWDSETCAAALALCSSCISDNGCLMQNARAGLGGALFFATRPGSHSLLPLGLPTRSRSRVLPPDVRGRTWARRRRDLALKTSEGLGKSLGSLHTTRRDHQALSHGQPVPRAVPAPRCHRCPRRSRGVTPVASPPGLVAGGHCPPRTAAVPVPGAVTRGHGKHRAGGNWERRGASRGSSPRKTSVCFSAALRSYVLLAKA